MLTPWGSLPKDQDNPQTIDEAIALAIANHEADPTAHLGDGESLEQHKSNEIIDHPINSVVDDKIITKRIVLETYFESVDAFEIVGSFFNALGLLKIYTTGTLNNVADVRNLTDEFPLNIPDISKDPIFECVAQFEGAYSFQGYLGIGDMDTYDGVGFEFSDSTLTAIYYTSDNVKHSISLSGWDSHDLHKYRVEILNGVSIVWYIDDLQVASLSLTGVTLADLNQGIMWTGYVKTLSSTHVAVLRLMRVLYQQTFIDF